MIQSRYDAIVECEVPAVLVNDGRDADELDLWHRQEECQGTKVIHVAADVGV